MEEDGARDREGRAGVIGVFLEEPEVAAVLAALVYFAPARMYATDPFVRAFARACELLVEGEVALSPKDIREWVEKWPEAPPRVHA